MDTESKEKNSSDVIGKVFVVLIIIWIFCHLFLIYWQIKHWQVWERYEFTKQFHIENTGRMIRYVGLSALWIVYGLWSAFVKDSLFHKISAAATGPLLAFVIFLIHLPY